MSLSNTVELACQLIERPSVTPRDEGCMDLIAKHLLPLGFEEEALNFGEVTNRWFRRNGTAPLFVFAGHTDVVPSGPPEKWHTPPFMPTIKDDILYGRGAADMKGSIAAFVTACKRFLDRHPDHHGSIALLLTSDEEGPAVNGTRRVIETLSSRGEHIDWCLVGEPSSSRELADTIKNGRRGSLSGKLVILGRQGHVAYPQLAINPIHQGLPALAELAKIHWDEGNSFFPPTSFQISNIAAGNGAGNVIPGEMSVDFNFRFSTELNEREIKKRVHAILDKYGLNYQLEWTLSGLPFITPEGELLGAAYDAITEITGKSPEISTAGGTSDGRFIAPTGAQVIELGPINASIHQIDEHVRISELDRLSLIYERILECLLS